MLFKAWQKVEVPRRRLSTTKAIKNPWVHLTVVEFHGLLVLYFYTLPPLLLGERLPETTEQTAPAVEPPSRKDTSKSALVKVHEFAVLHHRLVEVEIRVG